MAPLPLSAGLEPLTVQPWLAVVAKRITMINKKPINARRARSRGMRILNIHSGFGLLMGSQRAIPSHA